MSSTAGVWIDHRQSVVVTLTADGEHIAHIASNVEKHPERAGDSPLKGSYEAHQVPADNSRQRALTGKLNVYYDTVIAALHDCENVLLFGPGEAKGELHKRLLKGELGSRVAAVETEDKMTDPQIIAKVRAHFGISAPRAQQTE
jgi:hypothetical protein